MSIELREEKAEKAFGEKEAGADSVKVSGQKEPKLLHVRIWLCDMCLAGEGEECHTPGCALWLHNSPGHPIDSDLYEILS